MSLKETIRKQITEATKAKQDIQKNILKVIIGEIETLQNATHPDLGFLHPAPVSDDEIRAIIKKAVKGIDEMLEYKPGDPKLEAEKAVLQTYLPPEMSMYDLKVSLTALAEEIRAAKSDGQATGIAVKFFKENNIKVDGNVARKVVTEMRAN